MNQLWRTDAGKAAAVVPLALAIHVARRAGRQRGHRPWRAGPARLALGATLALAAPAVVVVDAARAGSLGLDLPDSVAGKGLLGAHILTTVVLEELLWRAALTLPLERRTRLGLAAVSATGFAAAHLHRDGLGRARPHLLNTAGWTASAFITRSVSWTTLAHAGYNLAAYALRPVSPTVQP